MMGTLKGGFTHPPLWHEPLARPEAGQDVYEIPQTKITGVLSIPGVLVCNSPSLLF
jgi:hypothetical protein